MLLATQAPKRAPSLRASRCSLSPISTSLIVLLSVALVVGQAPPPDTTHFDATRYHTHTNLNNAPTLSGDMGDPGTRGFKDPAQSLNPHVKSETYSAVVGAVMAQSKPAGYTDGWSSVKQNNIPSTVEVKADVGSGVMASDSGSETWYFIAPTDRFVGDFSGAYNGRLSFTLTHTETPAAGAITKAPDVILEASCGHSLYLFSFSDTGGQLSVMLNEDSGWIDSRTQRPPGAMDFLGVLSHLASIKIRGGFYSGAESTRLTDITVTAGKAWYPCCTIDGTVDICQKPPSSYYNPPNLKFYCEGHMYKPVRVTRVFPRYSRRTGGAVITVMGENFGLSGSQPIVRINGRPCQKTYFAPSVYKDESQYPAAIGNTYKLTGTGDRIVQPNNPAGNALVNAYNSASDSMKSQYPEHCWNGMKDDGTDRGYNYGTATSPKFINQGEIGIDTGGACFPTHCSSCAVPTLQSAGGLNLGGGWDGTQGRCSSANQITAYSSEPGPGYGCKGRATAVAGKTLLCNFRFPYLKYPVLCPEDADFSTTLKTPYSDTNGQIRAKLHSAVWNTDGIYASLDRNHEITEGITWVTHVNPAKSDTGTTPSNSSALYAKIVTIEVQDAVALCGFEVIGELGAAGAALTLAADLLSGDPVTSTVTSMLLNGSADAATAPFAKIVTPGAVGWSTAGALGVADFGTGYVVIDREIIEVFSVTATTLNITSRGAFGTPVSFHPSGKPVYGVKVCRGAALSFSAATDEGGALTTYTNPNAKFNVVAAKNAVCQDYSPNYAKDGRYCTIEVAVTNQILGNINVGDIVRRISLGKTTFGTTSSTPSLADTAGSMIVSSAAALVGATFLFDPSTSVIVSCGAAGQLNISAADLSTNNLTIGAVPGAQPAGTCVFGSIVTVKETPAAGTQDAYAGPAGQGFTTTFDASSTDDSFQSDIAEFALYRYILVDNEIMRIVALADVNANTTFGYERLTVARGQLGSNVEAHKRGVKITLLPRMAEIATLVTTTADKIYLTNGQDIVANNLGVVTTTATQIVAGQSPGANLQSGGTVVASYIKIDDEIMQVVRVVTYANSEGGTAYLEVIRAQGNTLATEHKAGALLHVMGCMDGDETGNNCGGSCKPCSSPDKGGPSQHEKLICISPEGISGPDFSNQNVHDLAVTVEASPGPTDSPYQIRQNAEQTMLVDKSTPSMSCISEQNRGFQYGAHDFVWGVHLRPKIEGEEIVVKDMAVDRNTGDQYVVGTMLGTLIIEGKHIHMSADFGGELTVSLTANAYFSATSTGASATTIVDTASFPAKNVTATEWEGKVVRIGSVIGVNAAGTPGAADCQARVVSYDSVTTTLTTTAFSNRNGACTPPAGNETYRLYQGSGSFIAKFSKDGRPVWLNKLDMASAGHEVVISSIAVDPSSGSHYVVGHMSDGMQGLIEAAVLNVYSVDSTTRVATFTPATTIALMGVDTYGQFVATGTPGLRYQEGFVVKYSSAGQYLSNEVIKARVTAAQLVISNLKIRIFHASTSNIINSQVRSDDPPPTEKTSTSLNNVEYDFGIARGGTLGGGHEQRSSITLAVTAAKYFAPGGQDVVAGVTQLMTNWYTGLTITITCGKGMGQSRTVQYYDASAQIAYVQPHWDGETMIPDTTSCYSISGKPSSHIHGQHWVNGGVYVTGNAVNLEADAATTAWTCFGQMPTVYQDKSTSDGVPVCAKYSYQNEQVNFLAQYDNDLRVFWVRFVYDGDATNSATSHSGSITALATTDDLVFIAGTFGTATPTTTDSVTLRLQNCTFDSAPVEVGPPANTPPSVTSLKKLCRTQASSYANIGAFPLQQANPLIVAATTLTGAAQTGATTTSATSYDILQTISDDYVQLGYVPSIDTAKSNMYVAAYDGSGTLIWYHFTSPATTANDNYYIEPTAMTVVQPAIGNKPLTGHWKSMSDAETLEGRNQPPDATAAKDISSQWIDSATVRGGYVYVTGKIYTSTVGHYADFGVTKYPLKCSRDKIVGQKNQTLANRMQDTQCTGQMQALTSGNAMSDVFMVKYAARGNPERSLEMSTYGTGVQPEVQYIRRTGMFDQDEQATGIEVHDLTGNAYVIGTYKSTNATTKYQGSNIKEDTFEASTGNDGGNTYTVTGALPGYSGDDHFGLQDAGRVNSLGCPMQRFSPADEHEEKLGLTGLPDCTLYTHSTSTSLTTGFVLKFNDNGDQTQRGNKNRKNVPSITGKIAKTRPCNAGAATCATSLSPCTGSTAPETSQHVFSGALDCKYHPDGCSCLVLDDAFGFSKDATGAASVSTSAGTSNTWSGMRVRITKGAAAGYEGVISAYMGNGAAENAYYTVPALPTMPDETSEFQLFPSLEMQPKIHLASCSAALDKGCAAYGVEWAKTIGLPIGQTANTYNAYGGPADVLNGDQGQWLLSPTAGTTTTLVLHPKDAQNYSAYYDDFVVYLSASTTPPFENIQVAEVFGTGAYAVSGAVAQGGNLTIRCGTGTCITNGLTPFYRLVAKDSTGVGVTTQASTGNPSSRQSSVPVAVNMIDGDVYVTGTFKGFDQFHFGLEGVDETVGFKNQGYDTQETYLVKLQD